MPKNLEARGRALAWSLAAQRLAEEFQGRDDWSTEQRAVLTGLRHEFLARSDEAECLIGDHQTGSG